MKNFTLLTALLFLFSCSPADNQSADALESRIARIESSLAPRFQIKGEDVATFNIDERLNALNIPGLSVAFAVNGEVEWSRAYGMADVGEVRPMETDTMLLAGSISKPVAALRAHHVPTMLLRLCDEAKFKQITLLRSPVRLP